MILTQQKLILALRERDIHVGTGTVHAWVRSGCPTVPGWKKPKFILEKVLAWLEAAAPTEPLEMEVRDRLYRRNLLRKT